MTTARFNLSTATAKAGKLGLGKSPEVICAAYEIKAEDRADFIAAVSAKLNEAEQNLALAVKRYSRTNKRSDANAVVRADLVIATYSRAIKIATA